MVQARKLDSAERLLASSVYADTIPFDRVYITDLDLGGAVTLAGMDLATRKFDYTINWVEAFGGVVDLPRRRSTLIHELCHVWQGENGVWPTFYMGQSIWSQLKHGVQDIWQTRKWQGWGIIAAPPMASPRPISARTGVASTPNSRLRWWKAGLFPNASGWCRSAATVYASTTISARASPAATGSPTIRAFPISAT